MSRSIFFSVGEPSGDQHAARLIGELSRQDPTIKTRGFGGSAMREAGCAVDLDLTEHAVVGLLEVLPKLRQFFRFVDDAEEILKADKPSAVVLVDFPGFNWHIAKRAKRLGIPVYYYCPPQLWAWGAWRLKKMRDSVDHVLAVLPIEAEYFPANGIATTFVGHPFFDAVQQAALDPQQFSRVNGAGRVVAVLPGSRTHEVHGNWPMMLSAIRELHRRHPGVHFAVAAYRDKHAEYCRAQMNGDDQDLPLDIQVGATSEIIEAADCAMMVSGSVSLELMARDTPAAVIYRVGRLFHAFAKRVMKIDSITLPNLMHDSIGSAYANRTGNQLMRERPFPEYVSVGDPRAGIEFLTSSVDRMLRDSEYLDRTRRTLAELREAYAKPGASRRAAQSVLSLLESAGSVRDSDSRNAA